MRGAIPPLPQYVITLTDNNTVIMERNMLTRMEQLRNASKTSCR